jgi:DNA-binding response OmpR family regulator
MGTKILIVDDDIHNLQLLHYILQPHGYDLTQAEDGIQALEILQHDKPDLIILDYMMPSLDGIDLSQRLRTIPGLRAVPVLIITAYDDGFGRIPMTALGIDSFMAKPITPTELVTRVETMLKN